MAWAHTQDGTRLSYEVVGAGDPLLLVNGQARDHRMWSDVVADFSADHQVVLVDPRGTGASNKPSAPPYSTRGFATDLVAVLDAAGIGRAHAYGFSMGGRVCQWLGIEHAGRIGALVLGATTPGDAHGIARTADVDAVLSAPRTPEALRRMIELMYSPDWIDAHPEVLTPVDPIPPHAQRQHYLASQGHDAWGRLPEITAPVLLIHGSDDLVNPTANTPLMVGQISGAQMCIVDRGRHGYFEEYRAKSSGVVLDFLAQHRIARAWPRPSCKPVASPPSVVLTYEDTRREVVRPSE
jgi:pimeloyl-ACP methyl ester carboxylesterase